MSFMPAHPANATEAAASNAMNPERVGVFMCLS
jgi:hypothetical protein